jgi:hypothetical protein
VCPERGINDCYLELVPRCPLLMVKKQFAPDTVVLGARVGMSE